LDGGFAKLEYLRSEDHPADLLASVRSGAEFKHLTNLIIFIFLVIHMKTYPIVLDFMCWILCKPTLLCGVC
jgi:hypothetical protein